MPRRAVKIQVSAFHEGRMAWQLINHWLNCCFDPPRGWWAEGMRIRRLITELKTQETDTNWRRDDMQPRHAPVFARTRPTPAGWQWRAAAAESDVRQYVLYAFCNPGRENWMAMLILRAESGASVIGRLEYHGSHPGLHAHAHCVRGGLEVGPSSIDNLARLPSSGTYHRRTVAWTENGFWEAARRFFRVHERKGPLL